MFVQMSFLIQFLNQQGLRATETLNLKAACSCEVERENILFLLAADHRHNNVFNETSLTQMSKPPEGRRAYTKEQRLEVNVINKNIPTSV